jgi:5-methylcytosine-specific restriction endonuclease McrA
MARLTADQWETIRAEREIDALTVQKLSGEIEATPEMVARYEASILADMAGESDKFQRDYDRIRCDIQDGQVRDVALAAIRIARKALSAHFRYMLTLCANARLGVRFLSDTRKHIEGQKDRERAARRRWHSTRYRGSVKHNLRMRVSALIRYHLRRAGSSKSGRTDSLLGYSMEDLERRLVATMPVGATWGDYLAGRLHIDHIIPLSAFNFSSEQSPDFAKAWALGNLRLLWADENLAKGAKLFAPFQPGLDLIPC